MLKWDKDYKFDFCDVLIVPADESDINSRQNVNLNRTFEFNNGCELSAVPIVASNMDTVGTFTMGKALKKYGLLTAIHKHYTLEEKQINFDWNASFYTVGINDNEKEELKLLRKNNKNYFFLNIDVANGYIQKFIDTIKYYRNEYPNAVICAGNVVTPEGCRRIIQAGADIVKVGLGSGAGCLTREKTGVGYPQLSAIMECSDYIKLNHNKCYLMSDGGCVNPGDICKAFCAGANFVMLGGMLSGHDECEIEFYLDDKGKQMAIYTGMSSELSLKKHYGGKRNYRTSEGRTVFIERRGPVDNTIEDICGGLRSCGTYINAKNISDFYSRSRFIKVLRQLNTSLVKE